MDTERREPAAAPCHRNRSTRRRLAAPVALALGAVFALSLAVPEPAAAVDVNPLHAIDDILGAGVDAVTGGVGKVAVESFGAIIKALFAWPAKMINRELLAWLVAVPDYAIHPETARSGQDGSNLAQLGTTTSAMAFAALGAVGTVSAIRYWAAGLTGSGGLEAFEGLARTVAAALFIVLWPWLFRHCADLANEAGRALLGSGSVLDDTARLVAAAFAAGATFNILSILIAVGAALLFLALLLSKIAVSAATALVFVGMPLAVMLWPIPELAWIARTAMRAFATVLAIPLAWAVCFATFAAVGMDALSLKGAGKVVDALMMPLVAIALLWITVTVPRTLTRMAMLGAGAGGGGFVGRTASYLAARRADAAVAQAVPAGLGGRKHDRGGATTHKHDAGEQRTPASRRASGQPTGSASALSRQPRAVAGAASVSAAAAGGASAAVAGVAQGGGWKPPKGFEQGAGGPGSTGLRNPSWQEIKDHVPIELDAAAERQSATTRGDVADAIRSLSPDTQRGVLALMEAKGGQIRGQMAYQAARGDVSEADRDAFRTLAAASPEVRAQGIGDFIDGGPIEPPASPDGQADHDASSQAPAAPVSDGGPMGPAGETPSPSAPALPQPIDSASATPPPRRGNDSMPG
jgi:hypothetical protein